MEHHKLFPTNIFIQDNFFSKPKVLQKLIEKEYENKDITNWQSKPDLLKKPSYREFVESVLRANVDIIKKLSYKFESLTITDMWSNILKPGETHRPHTHANNFLSGVYYPYAENTSGIVFTDPRHQANVIKPSKLQNTMDNSDVMLYQSKTNRIIIFPSWLQHFVPINTSKENRFSISWNLQLKGKVGSSEEYQSAIF